MDRWIVVVAVIADAVNIIAKDFKRLLLHVPPLFLHNLSIARSIFPTHFKYAKMDLASLSKLSQNSISNIKWKRFLWPIFVTAFVRSTTIARTFISFSFS